jgi:hypothetical protein
MNLFELQERLKDFSQDQLVREMQAPTGTAPQYLVLSELQRRQRMMAESQAQMPQDQTTVAQDAVAAAGVPQAGLAGIAQAMAPRTDMDMNTGVAPVERMAEGGAMRPPRLEDQGEPISREELAASRRDRLLQDAVEEALSMMESSPAGAGRSVINRILQQVAPEGYAAASDAPGRGLDEDGGMGVLGVLPALLARRRGVDLTKYPSRMAGGGVVRMQPGGLAGISRDLGAYSPTMEGAAISRRMMEEEDARRRRAELAAAMFQYGSGRMPVPTGEGQLFDLNASPMLPQRISPEADAPPEGTDLRGLGTIVGEFISGEDPEAAATRLLESGQIDEEQYRRYVSGSGSERERVAREALDLDPRREFPDAADVTDAEDAATAGEVFNLPELVIDSEPGLSFGDQFPPVDVRRSSNEVLGFGAITPTGAPIPFALPRGTTPTEGGGGGGEGGGGGGGGGAAAPAADDAFQQDKWLALAQFGLNLMSSQQPTFGGAIGEAGLAGITALRTARDERDARAAAAQARSDRMAAAASRGEREEAYPYRQVDDIVSLATLFRQAAADIRAANFDQIPAANTPEGIEYRRNLIEADELTRRALTLSGVE